MDVAPVLAWLEESLEERVALADLERMFGHSCRTIEYAVKKATGLTFRDYLSRLRINEARRLLEGTDRRIAEIGRLCGFPDPAVFSRAFRRAVGTTPRAYRRAHPRAQERSRVRAAATVGVAELPDGKLRGSWRAILGNWEEARGALVGEGEEDFALVLERELNGPFEISFEMRPSETRASGRRSAVTIGLGNDRGSTIRGYQVALSPGANAPHRLLRNNRTVTAEPGGLHPGRWQAVLVRFRDDILSVSLDASEILRHRELFPLPHYGRTHFSIGGWNTSLALRRVRLRIFAPPRTSDPDTVGNAYAAQEEYQRAMESYEAALDATRDVTRRGELLFRIGMCHIALGLTVRARSYLERSVPRLRGTSWALFARLEALGTRLGRLGTEELRKELERCLREADSPSARRLLADFLVEEQEEAARRGDYPAAAELGRFAWENRDPATIDPSTTATILASHLFNFGRYAEAAKMLGEALVLRPRDARLSLSLSLTLASCGRHREAEEALRAVEKESYRFLQGMGAVRKGILLQARWKLGDALASFRRTMKTFADVPSQSRTARLLAIALLALAGRDDEAERLCAEVAARAETWSVWRADIDRTRFFLRGRYEEMIAVLEEYVSRRHEETRVAIQEAMLLSLLHELAGDRERSKHHLERLQRSYARGPYWRLILPASYLLGEIDAEAVWKDTVGFGILSPVFTSSSLFYVMGLVLEKRAEKGAAREFFRKAAEADPLNHWPVVLARKKLGGRLPKEVSAFLRG